MDKRYKILIGVLIAISALAILIATSNSQNKSEALRTQYVTPSAKVSNDITPAEQLEQCKRYIVDNEDFPGSSSKECKGIQEDDSRLNRAYQAISPNGTYDLCEQMYALIYIDNELSGKITNVLIENNMPEDTLVANVDICTDLGYYSIFE